MKIILKYAAVCLLTFSLSSVAVKYAPENIPFDFEQQIINPINGLVQASWLPGYFGDGGNSAYAMGILVFYKRYILALPIDVVQQNLKQLHSIIFASSWSDGVKKQFVDYMNKLIEIAGRIADRQQTRTWIRAHDQKVKNLAQAKSNFDNHFALPFWHLLHDAKMAPLGQKSTMMAQITEFLAQWQESYLWSEQDYLEFTGQLIDEAGLPAEFTAALKEIFSQRYFAPMNPEYINVLWYSCR